MVKNLNKLLFSLGAISQLKQAGILEKATSQILLDKPEELTKKLELIKLISPVFKSPYPLVDDTAGEIKFAKTERNKPVGIDIDELLQGIIIGSSGSGKSILSYAIALQAMNKGVKCWIFAKGNDAEKLSKIRSDILVNDYNGQLPINLIASPKNYPIDSWESMHWGIFAQASSFYDGTKSFILRENFELSRIYQELDTIQSFYELHDYLTARKIPNYSRESGYKDSALNRIGGLLKGSLRKDLDCSVGFEDIVNHNVIFNYKALSSETSVYYINAMIARLMCYKEVNDVNSIHLIILDDSMQVFDGNRLDRRTDLGIGFINHLLFETRKYQIKFLANAQVPSLLSKGILGSSNFKCLMNIQNAEEINFFLNILGVYEKEQRLYAHRLDKKKREMILKLPDSQYAFLAYIPIMSFAKLLDSIKISKDEKYQNNQRILTPFSSTKPRVSYKKLIQAKFEKGKTDFKTQKENPKPNQKKPKKNLDTNTHKYLSAVHIHQYKQSQTEIVKLAGLSAGTGSRVAKQCVKNGYIKMARVSWGRGRPRYPVLTKKGYQFLGIKENKFFCKGAGDEHKVAQSQIAELFSKTNAGSVSIELNRNNKFIDVGVVSNDGGKVLAIEIEMSSANIAQNIKKDINDAKALFVIVACKNEKVKNQAEKIVADLPKELSSRTEICLIGDFLKRDIKEVANKVFNDD